MIVEMGVESKQEREYKKKPLGERGGTEHDAEVSRLDAVVKVVERWHSGCTLNVEK